jgi:hypothetical protein
VINIRSKTKARAIPTKKAKKGVRKTTGTVSRRPEGYFKDALTPDDIAEINLFGRVIAQMNSRAEERRRGGKVEA